MKLQSVAVAVPSRVVTNETVLEMIERESGNSPETQRIVGVIARALPQIGTKTRHWLDKGETAQDVTLRACREALQKLQNGPDIDLVIYASVFSEIVEPAAANFYAGKLGLDGSEAFDLKAACDGWMKALKVAEALIRSGSKKRALVINSEFSMVPHYAIYPHLFKITSRDQLQWRLPAYTIGEAATATVVSGDADSRQWDFTTLTRNELNDLCSVTSQFYRRDSENDRLAKDGPGWFTSWAADLSGAGVPLAVDTFTKAGIKQTDVDILFTHASGTRDWMNIAGQIGLRQKIFDIHPEYGNLVSASVPAAMALAEKKGRLNRGDKVAILVASAGMCASATQFVY